MGTWPYQTTRSRNLLKAGYLTLSKNAVKYVKTNFTSSEEDTIAVNAVALFVINAQEFVTTLKDFKTKNKEFVQYVTKKKWRFLTNWPKPSKTWS